MNAVGIFLFILLHTSVLSEKLDSEVRFLEPEVILEYAPREKSIGIFATDLRIYCYRGNEKSLANIFQTIQLQLEIGNDEFTQYEGPTPEIVKEHYEEQRSIFSFNFLTSKKTRLKLNPFNQTCIGIDTVERYQVRLHLVRIDFWRVILLLIGFLIFWFAEKLSKNSLFYYLSGILLGIFASFLVLVYFMSKLIPRRPMMYGVLIGGWTIAIYFAQMFWENIQMIFMTYQVYVFWYILITGFISFVICYRFGPPKNQRSIDLIKWGLQLSALAMIFFSSHYQEASTVINILIVIFYYFPRTWIKRIRLFYLNYFPPKPRLLTNEEYYEEGVRETTKALDELKKFCNSPECKQWRLMTKLKDPMRFASFVEGTSHISDQEILEYETSRADISDSDLTEDEEDNENQNENRNTRISIKGISSNGGSSGLVRRFNSEDLRPSSERRTLIYKSYNREYSDED